MSEANRKDTTATTRRDIAAGGIAMLVLAAAAAGVDKAAELDGELIAAVSELRALNDRYLNELRPVIRASDEAASEAAWKHCDEVIWDREDELVETITGTPAKTPEGLRAKAQALELWLNRWVVTRLDSTFDEEAEPHEFLAMSLARDLTGRGA